MIHLEVVGIPAPQGSKRGFVVGQRAVVVEGGSKAAREKVGSWRGDVIEACQKWIAAAEESGDYHSFETVGAWQPIAGPVILTVTFRLPKPKSVPKRRHWPCVAPDLGKLLRSTEDALKLGLIYRDDSLIVDVQARKVYAAAHESTGATITLQEIA